MGIYSHAGEATVVRKTVDWNLCNSTGLLFTSSGFCAGLFGEHSKVSWLSLIYIIRVKRAERGNGVSYAMASLVDSLLSGVEVGEEVGFEGEAEYELSEEDETKHDVLSRLDFSLQHTLEVR